MTKVYVGLSGGVDSAVSAALLKERGYDVTGVFIKIWRPEFTECTWKEDRVDAMRVCAALEIPFREIDLSVEYKRDIIDGMVRDYSKGITPNPDVLCNRSIKFGGFAKWAINNGADMIATGHYARVKNDAGTFRLLRGVDTGKDQSYFLHLMTQQELSRTIFPVGEYQKSEVRALAEKFILPVAQKADSQGLCFVGDISMSDFLSRLINLEPGPVIDLNGKTVGKHFGAPLYTIGQRHGFDTTGGDPYFVTRIDVDTNSLIASMRREDASSSEVNVAQMHWINKPQNESLSAQVRYRETPVAIELINHQDKVKVKFAKSQIAAPGQSLVVYAGEECLGGGIIARV